jgi:hypothetical protein
MHRVFGLSVDYSLMTTRSINSLIVIGRSRFYNDAYTRRKMSSVVAASDIKLGGAWGSWAVCVRLVTNTLLHPQRLVLMYNLYTTVTSVR